MSMTKARNLDRIEAIIAKDLEEQGFELYNMKCFRAGRRLVLRIFIDQEGGVTIGDCEAVSRRLSMLLDVEEFSDRPYRLEISSVGIDRPLRTERDFRRNRGREATVFLKNPRDGTHSLSGTIQSCEGNILLLATPGGGEKIGLDAVARGKILVHFK